MYFEVLRMWYAFVTPPVLLGMCSASMYLCVGLSVFRPCSKMHYKHKQATGSEVRGSVSHGKALCEQGLPHHRLVLQDKAVYYVRLF